MHEAGNDLRERKAILPETVSAGRP